MQLNPTISTVVTASVTATARTAQAANVAPEVVALLEAASIALQTLYREPLNLCSPLSLTG
jgi:hypothetical protein